MTTFYDISNDFERACSSLTRNVQSVLYSESVSLLNDFKERSPVDTGEYQSSWELRKPRFMPARSLAGYTICNKKPYAEYMEYGALIGKEPWFYTGKKKSKKLSIRNNRVWAGGITPGHSKSVNGAIGPVLVNNTRRLNVLTRRIADAVIGGFGGK